MFQKSTTNESLLTILPELYPTYYMYNIKVMMIHKQQLLHIYFQALCYYYYRFSNING